MARTSANKSRKINRKPVPDRQPDAAFPSFDDPAYSNKAAGSAVTSPRQANPPKDTQYDGHSEFSQDAALDEPLVLDDADDDQIELPGSRARK